MAMFTKWKVCQLGSSLEALGVEHTDIGQEGIKMQNSVTHSIKNR